MIDKEFIYNDKKTHSPESDTDWKRDGRKRRANYKEIKNK